MNEHLNCVRSYFLAERIKQILHGLFGNDAARAPHEEFQRVILPPRDLHDLAIDADLPLGGVDLHIRFEDDYTFS